MFVLVLFQFVSISCKYYCTDLNWPSTCSHFPKNLWVPVRSKWARPFVPNIAVSLGQKGRAYLAPIRRHTPCRQDTPVHVWSRVSATMLASLARGCCWAISWASWRRLVASVGSFTHLSHILTLTFDLSSAFLEWCCFHGNFACGVALSCRVWTRCGSTHSRELFEVRRPSAQLGLSVFHSWLWAKSNFHFFRPWVSGLLEVKIHSSCTWQPTSWSR